jgi:putative transposase
VPVPHDPFDIGAAFAFADREWVECHSEHDAILHGYSEREVHLASEELRKRRRNHSGRFALTAKSSPFLEFVGQEEEILVQRLSDLEARSLQTQPELFAKTIGTLTPDPPTMPAAALLPLEPPTTFVTYGEL